MLPNQYRSSDLHADLRSAFAHVYNSPEHLPAVGAYNDGLLMVVEEATATTILDQWRWLVDEACIALMTTGLGDVFFWNPSNGVNHLETQRATVEFVDAEIDWFLGEFLSNPGVVGDVLRRDQFEKVVQMKRPLLYHEVFILQPWLMLGGADRIENYTIGKCGEYLALVGQAHHPPDVK